jgi:methylated-DNA-[protein]-cysteine S-methyltransferase
VSLVFEPTGGSTRPAGEAPPRHRWVASPVGDILLGGGERLERVELRDFELCVAPAGTPFQLEVWHALASVPYGSTVTYQALAARVGRPRGARAVGQAVARNPLLILVPCHRVLPADGRLGGFASGPECKAALLQLEGAR